MKLEVRVIKLHPRHVFTIARAERRSVENVLVRLEHGGVMGFGEASPNAFYGESSAGVAQKLEAFGQRFNLPEISTPWDLEQFWEESWRALAPSRAAQCAIDLALWDWLGKTQNRTCAELAGAPGGIATPVISFGTIGLTADPFEFAIKLGELAGFERIKVKSDARADTSAVRQAAAASQAKVAVDANCAWGDVDLSKKCEELAGLGALFVEQPVAPGAERQPFSGKLAAPIVADESCVTEADLERALEYYDGINIKLVKCGGITPALRMLKRAREARRVVMIGCMLETSVLIAAGAAVAQRADYADLDGAWLLGDDRAEGWTFRDGVLSPRLNRFGLGVEIQPGIFD